MAANAAIVAGAFAVSRLLGMAREVVVAAKFGTGETYDAYVAAFRVPDLLFVLVMSGAFGSAFIPVFGGFLAQGDETAAWRLANTLLTYTVVLLLLAGQLMFFLAGPLIGTIIAPDLPPDAQELAANLTRLLLLSPLLLGLGAAAKGMLEAHDAFTLPAVAPVLYNLGIIAGAVALTPLVGIYGLALGVVAGAAAHAGVQFWALLRLGLRLRPNLRRQTAGLGTVVRLMGPRVTGQALAQANLVVMTNLASGLGEGRISALSYANHLVLLPHGVLALSLSTVIFPRMAREFAQGRLDDLRRTLGRALAPLIFLTIPAVVSLIAFREGIVQVAFQYGSFSAESTALVADATGYFALGLLARAAVEPITRAFYAMRDTRTPLVITAATTLANVGLSVLLADLMGHAGLALSISITISLRLALLLLVFGRKLGGVGLELVPSLGRMLVAGAVLALLAVPLGGWLARVTDPSDGRSAWGYVAFVATLGGALATYTLVSAALKIPEVGLLAARIRGRMGR